MMRVRILLCAMLLAFGCSDDGDGGGTPDGSTGGGTATINLSGAQTASLPALAVAGRVATESFHTVGVGLTAPQGSFTGASISIRLPGAPAAGTYPSSAFEIGVLQAVMSDGKSWTAFTTPPIGSVGTLTLSSVEILSSAGGTTLFTIHGSLAMSTLVDSAGGPQLMMTSTF